MALSVSEAFGERLKEMEQARNERLSLLHGEKATQATQSQILSSKQINIALAQRKCWSLHHKVSTLNFKISALNSQLLTLDANYTTRLQTLRVLKREVEELEEVEKERNRFYIEKSEQMEEFKENVDIFIENCQHRVRELRSQLNESRSNLVIHQSRGSCNRESEMTIAKMQKHELLAGKTNLDKDLAHNRKVLAELQERLEKKREHS